MNCDPLLRAIDASSLSMNKVKRISIPFRAAVSMLSSYAWVRLAEQARAVAFIVLYLGTFQVFVLGITPRVALGFAGGIGLVILGLALFLEGLFLGLMPIGERVGLKLPLRAGLVSILVFGFLLGLGATLAEPAVAALRSMGGFVHAWDAPLLYHMLENRAGQLVGAIGIGVGIAVALGMLRIFFALSIKPFVYVLIPLLLLFSAYCAMDPNLAVLLGLAWDTGAVTTGAVTVPLVLALGIGVSRAVGKQKEGASGFGMIMLASVVPILAVLLLGVIVNQSLPPKMSETAFFEKGHRQSVRPLFEQDADLVRHAFQRGTEAGRRAYFGSAAAHEAGVRSLEQRDARQALLGDVSLAQWLRTSASAWEQALLQGVPTNHAAEEDHGTSKGVFSQSLRVALQSVVPLTALLLFVLFVLLRDRLPYHDEMVLGIGMSLVGMAVLTSGIRTGLAPMGDEAGRSLPRLFRYEAREAGRIVMEPFVPATDLVVVHDRDGRRIQYFYLQDGGGRPRRVAFDPLRYEADTHRYEHVEIERPLFQEHLTILGLGLVLLFAFGLGYGSTLAEPALSALGRKVEEITVGVVKRKGVVRAVSAGVGLGLVIGMAGIVYDIPTFWLILPPYILLLPLTYWSDEEFAGMAWDCGGVTTGVVTVPLVMAMGVSVGGALKVVDGFGVLALASAYPIVTVMFHGMVLRLRQRRSIRAIGGGAHG
jgi:hypothetical protein